MKSDIILPVKYFAQSDSDTTQGYRMCFSSSVAMLVNFLRPGVIKGPWAQSDDRWLTEYVSKHGDTTNGAAQVAALRDVGIPAKYSQRLDTADIFAQLERGLPVPCGILHHGPVSHPTGGGHWVLVIGCTADKKYLYVHDPAGELDLVAGGYGLGRSGAEVRYSVRNFEKRWLAGPVPGVYQFTRGTGWGVIASRPAGANGVAKKS